MSRVYFTSRDGGAELRGSERAWLGAIAEGIGFGLLPEHYSLLPLIYPEDQQARLKAEPAHLRTALRTNLFGIKFKVGDKLVEPWDIGLNTAIRLGNDFVRLGAFIHAQCEVHGWFAEEDHIWVAETILKGQEDGLYRPDQGWDEVRSFFVAASGDVFMSYSATDGFPSITPVLEQDMGPEPQFDTEHWWYETLTAEERWEKSSAAVKAKMPSISEKTMDEGFGDQIDAIALWKAAR
jgi:hypothetical protein